MNAEDHDLQPPAPRDPVYDRRIKPRGVLPRHLQTWVMLGVAAAMLLVIVVTGHPTAPRRAADATSPASSASALPPDRLRQYQEQLVEQEARLRKELADAQAAATAASPQSPAGATPASVSTQTDPLADERRRREYASLFAESVAFTRRADAGTALSEALARAALGPTGSPAPALSPADVTPAASRADAPAHAGGQSPRSAAQNSALGEPGFRPPPPAQDTPSGDKRRLLEGTVIEAVLTNRLEGSFSSPVNAMVTTPVYAQDRQTILIPAGARVLGTAAPVQAFGETRLAVRFHRLVMPDGSSYSLDQFTALNERGDAGLKDQVDRHYLQIFGASIAIGTLSGLAQYSTRSGSNGPYTFSDAYGQGMGGSLAASGGRILDRFLNVLPSVTIREGHRIKVYLTADLELPPYRKDLR